MINDRLRTKFVVGVLAGLVVVGAAACGDDDEDVAITGGPDGTAAEEETGDDPSAEQDDGAEGDDGEDDGGGGAELVIADIAFPDALEVGPGETISVVNEDTAPHTVTSEDGGFDVDVDGEGTASFDAPDEAGDFAVICELHPNMEMTITVTG